MGDNGPRRALVNQPPCSAPRSEICTNRICDTLSPDIPLPRRRDLERGAQVSAGLYLKLWTVVDGLVALCSSLPDGRRQLVSLATPGDLVCPLAGSHGTAVWIEALAPSRLCELDLSARSRGINRDPVLSAELFRVAHRQIQSVSAHLVTLGRLDGMERVCLFLTDMAWRIGVETPGGLRVHLPLSREDIADYLGLNAETVSRIFSRVKKAKLVTFLSPTDYIVADIEALQSRAPVAAPHGPEVLGTPSLEMSPSCQI